MDKQEQIEEIQSYLTEKVAESEIKAQAVKEFAEKLKDKFNGLGILFYDKAQDCHYYRSIGKEIDELLKEYEK